uniref:Uncharacterized protein n=1 Tax=Rhizophora mucronata TaxID=61149 RepID=A0A2P2QR76_RHIMU
MQYQTVPKLLYLSL